MRKISRSGSRSPKNLVIGHVVDLQRTATKCTKLYVHNARADILVYALSLLLGNVPVAVVAVFYV